MAAVNTRVVNWVAAGNWKSISGGSVPSPDRHPRVASGSIRLAAGAWGSSDVRLIIRAPRADERRLSSAKTGGEVSNSVSAAATPTLTDPLPYFAPSSAAAAPGFVPTSALNGGEDGAPQRS